MTVKNESIEKLLREARFYFRTQKRDEALAYYTKAGKEALRAKNLEGILRAGSGLDHLDDLEAAKNLYEQGLKIFPEDYALNSRMGVVLMNLNLNPPALPYLKKALALKPDDPDVIFNTALGYQANENFPKALDLFNEAFSKGADKDLIFGAMAEIYEQTNQLEDLETHLEKSLKQSPNDPFLLFYAAKFARRKGDYENALKFLEKAENVFDFTEIDSSASFEKGRIFDKLGKYELAYKYFEEGNKKTAHENASPLLNKKNSLDEISRAAKRDYGDWSAVTAVPLPKGQRKPVFLIGFPRSGTTLLDQILGSHSEIDVLEETPFLAKGRFSLIESFGNFEKGLEAADQGRWNLLRNDILNSYRHQKKKGPFSQIVDKLPLNIIEVPFILKIFPGAKFIVALRHPFDCTLSCFMQNFGLNNAMLNFTSLDGATHYYSEVFSLWKQYERKLKPDYIYVRYEDILSNLEGETRKIFEFLDLPWEPGVLEYQKNALEKDRIKTPSYHQVIQPIYMDSRYRWKNYENFFKPYRDRLTPFCEAFGYEC